MGLKKNSAIYAKNYTKRCYILEKTKLFAEHCVHPFIKTSPVWLILICFMIVILDHDF